MGSLEAGWPTGYLDEMEISRLALLALGQVEGVIGVRCRCEGARLKQAAISRRAAGQLSVPVQGYGAGLWERRVRGPSDWRRGVGYVG